MDVVAIDLEVDERHERAISLYQRLGFRPLARSRWVRELGNESALSETGCVTRRGFMKSGFGIVLGSPLIAALRDERLEQAAGILARATEKGEVAAAVLHVVQREKAFTRCFGTVQNQDAMFLLGSISKPIGATALMTLFDRGEFKLGDPVKKFPPQFSGGRREEVTMQHLLTHVSGLPDQLAENVELRSKHATLLEFADHAIRTPLQFIPGSKYQYSSMAILLAARVAEVISGTEIRTLVERSVFQPLRMQHSAQGLGQFKLEEMVRCQTEHAAREAGGGDPKARDWDWNSRWWRELGAPWGGTHASAPDLAKLLAEFLHPSGACLIPETTKLMVRNHNPSGLTPRGLGWNIGSSAGGKGCSEKTFGHSGSTGTMAWTDPATEMTCVVLTSLPAGAVHPHPRDLVSDMIAASQPS
jgi:CubicO group peptidase (beta-lactamase class C family)